MTSMRVQLQPETSPLPPAEPSGPQWSKDYVEHLRTIHFSLMAICVAALVLSLAETPSDIRKARSEVHAIAELVRIWDPNWVESSAQQVGNKDRTKNPTMLYQTDWAEHIAHFEIEGFKGDQRARADIRDPNWIVHGPVSDLAIHAGVFSLPHFCQNPDVTLTKPNTLEEFRRIWNVLNEKHSIRFPTRLADDTYSIAQFLNKLQVKDMGRVQWLPRGSEARSEMEVRVEPCILSDAIRKALPDLTTDYGFVGTFDNYQHQPVLPVSRYQEIEFRAQDALREHFQQGIPEGGSFDHSFSELDKITKDYQSLEFDKFDVILEAEQNRTGDSFEAFGVKFPAEATTRWGVVVVLAVQLYFWIHLHELAQRLQPNAPGWEVAFIGMYSSHPSRVVYSLSTHFLPVAAIIALGVKGLFIGDFQRMYWWVLGISTALSIGLAILSWDSAPTRDRSVG
jgi:hypothetical protein